MFQRFFDEGLAQASFLIGCDRTKRAVVIPAAGAIATICEGGYRSTLAASLLARESVAHVVNVVGGMTAYRALETI